QHDRQEERRLAARQQRRRDAAARSGAVALTGRRGPAYSMAYTAPPGLPASARSPHAPPPAAPAPLPRRDPPLRRLAVLRRRARVDALLAAQTDHARQRRLARRRLDLRHRRRLQGLRDAVPASGGARRPLRELAQAARLRAGRRHRRAPVELRPVRGYFDLTLDADPRPHVLGARRRAAHLLARPALALRARRDD